MVPYGSILAMQTNFTPQQLIDPGVAEADGILKTCVHYGFCTGTCPTYVLYRDENDSPRGRIDLIKAMLEKGGPPDAKTVHHLDRCLSCLSCVTTCAVQVDYMHLIDVARQHIEKHYRRPLSDRLLRTLVAKVMPYPKRFSLALRFAKVAQPLARLMPGRVRSVLAIAKSRQAYQGQIAPGIYSAEGDRKMRVVLLTGCVQQVLDRNINAATIRILRRHGCEVIVASGAGCCGALPLHMGLDTQAKELASANVFAWTKTIKSGLDAVVVNMSGCGTTVKDYGHLLGTEAAKQIGSLTRDITELLHELSIRPDGQMKHYKVAYHDACSLQHGQRVAEIPRRLLSRAGFKVVDVPERHLCCGSAGTYNLLQPDVASELGRRKGEHVNSVDPDIVAAGNLGCLVQISRYVHRPIVHTVELLDWATGGPRPPALSNWELREPVPQQQPTMVIPIKPINTTSPSRSTDTAIW